MKKFLATIMVLGAAICLHAKWVDCNSKDMAEIDAEIKACTGTAKNVVRKRTYLHVVKKMATKAPKSYAEFMNTVETSCKEQNASEADRNFIVKIIGIRSRDCVPFRAQLAKYCLANPSVTDINWFSNKAVSKYFTKEQLYTGAVTCLSKYTLKPSTALRLFKVAVNNSNAVDQARVKQDLQQLNKIYSLKLLDDKAKWTPVVQGIRTILTAL